MKTTLLEQTRRTVQSAIKMAERKAVVSRKEDLFGNMLQQTYLWLGKIMSELHTTDRHRAYLSLRAVLHTLRDRLTLDDTVHLGAQLPMLIRGIYYEGWEPAGKPVKYNRSQFLGAVANHFRVPEKINPEEITYAVFSVLQQNLSGGELQKIQHALPRSFAGLWQRIVVH